MLVESVSFSRNISWTSPINCKFHTIVQISVQWCSACECQTSASIQGISVIRRNGHFRNCNNKIAQSGDWSNHFINWPYCDCPMIYVQQFWKILFPFIDHYYEELYSFLQSFLWGLLMLIILLSTLNSLS